MSRRGRKSKTTLLLEAIEAADRQKRLAEIKHPSWTPEYEQEMLAKLAKRAAREKAKKSVRAPY